MKERIRVQEKERIDSVSFGLYIPQTEVTNRQIENWNVLSPGGNALTADNISRRTGIERRYIATKSETVGQMAIVAAEEALGTKRKVGFVIATTSYPEINLSKFINREKNLQAMSTLDVYAACSGFVRALNFIKSQEESFMGRSVLMVSSEKYSDKLYDLRKKGIENDPSLSQTIFSDGAAAMLFTYGKDFRILAARNKRLPVLLSPAIKMPIRRDLMEPPYIEEYITPSASGKFEQEGKTVYRAVIENVPGLIRETIRESDLKEKDIKLIIPHQGSGHIIEGLQRHLDIPIMSDIEDGNFSSASIPKALLRAREEGKIHRRDKIVLAGFGAGLFSSIAVVELH